MEKENKTKKTEEKVKTEKKSVDQNQNLKSSKGFYHYIKEAWKKPNKEVLRERMISWRQGERITKLENPLRLDKARALGYKAKKGFIVLRVVLKRGGRKRVMPNKKRMSTKQSVRKDLKMNYQWIAESRAEKKYTNLEVLNSYMIGKDGKFYFFEVIMVDPERPEIKNDRTINWICSRKNQDRAARGLTRAAKKSRGLTTKRDNLKVRPSARSWNRKGR